MLRGQTLVIQYSGTFYVPDDVSSANGGAAGSITI